MIGLGLGLGQIGCSYTFLLQHDQCSAAQSSLDALDHPWYAVVVDWY